MALKGCVTSCRYYTWQSARQSLLLCDNATVVVQLQGLTQLSSNMTNSGKAATRLTVERKIADMNHEYGTRTGHALTVREGGNGKRKIVECVGMQMDHHHGDHGQAFLGVDAMQGCKQQCRGEEGGSRQH